MDNTFLCHHGVKGQKWGVRRYRNEDGSYTDKGRKRYSNQEARRYYKINRLQRKQERSKSFKEYQNLDRRIRKVQTRYDRRASGLSESDINAGRRRIASSRVMRKKVGAITSAAATAAGIAVLGPTLLGVGVSTAGAIGTAAALSRLPYYQMESSTYKRKV